MKARKLSIIFMCALVGWALCAATMGIGQAITSSQNALILHAILAPIFFMGVSLVYFKRYHFTSPIQTALIFTGFVMVVDFFVVALLMLRSLDMFASLLGTWIPFALIFASTYLTGLAVTGSAKHKYVEG